MKEKTDAIDKSKIKKTGFIRWGAIVPITILVLVVFLFGTLFFDSSLKFAFEKIGSKLLKSKVTIEKVDTSFSQATLEIVNCGISEKKKSETYIFKISKIKFQLMWDAILRGKFVVSKAFIDGIEIGGARELSYNNELKIIHKAYAKDKVSIKNEASLVLQDEYQGNVLGDLAKILDGGDPLEGFKPTADNFESIAKIEQLQAALDEKEVLWDKRINSLPTQKDINQIAKSIDNIKPKKLKKIKDITKAIKNLNSSTKIIKEKSKIVKEVKSSIVNDTKYFKDGIGSIDNLAKLDYKNLEERLKIPEIDTKNLAQQLFKKFIMKKLGPYSKYIEVVVEYLPESKKSTKNKIERAKGKNYVFGRVKTYPLFWLKEARISSSSVNNPNAGDLNGSMSNITNNPKLLGIPSRVKFNGGFTQMGIGSIDFDLKIDLTKKISKQVFNLKVADYSVDGMNFISSDAATLGFKKATGTTEIKGKMVGGEINMNMLMKLSKIDYVTKAKSSIISDALIGATREAKILVINSHLTGNPLLPSIKVSSNFTDALKRGFGKQVDEKIAESKNKLRKMVADQINGPKEKLEGRLKKVLGKNNKIISDIEKKFLGSQKLASNKVKSAKKQSKKQSKKKFKKTLKKIKF